MGIKRQHPYDAFSKVLDDQQNTTSRSAEVTRTIYYGEVVENEDPLNRGRLRVYIRDLDRGVEKNKQQLAWCNYFFATNVQHIPKIGETVAIILENPWKKDHGRWWLGPIFDERFISIPLDSVAMAGRPGNTVELKDDGKIVLTTDVNRDRLDAQANITMDRDENEIRVSSEDIIFESTANQAGDEFAVPYGERLVELLRFILQTMKTHSHPPNSPPTPDFFVQADRYLRDLEDWLINKNVRTRGN